MTPRTLVTMRKEVRALAPTLSASAIAVLGLMLIRTWWTAGVVWFVCGLGSVALGAWSIGHEYALRTLPTLLAQPATRARLIGTKGLVLAALLLFLNGLGLLAAGEGATSRALASLAVAMVCGLCLAPALTIAARGALGGTVFTLAVPAMLWVSGEVVGVNRYGAGSPEVDALKAAFVWRGMALAAIAGGAMSWLLFLRLEAVEGGQELRLPGLFSAGRERHAAPRPSSPLWQLVGKEVRLQSLSLTVAALYVMILIGIALVGPFVPALARLPYDVLAVFYVGLLTVLVGALASADERQLGTRDWQQLQPIAWRTQWGVKIAAVMVVGLIAAGVPAVLTHAPGVSSAPTALVRESLRTAFAVIVLTSASLFVSSLCSSGMQAFLLFLPAALAIAATQPAGLTLFHLARQTFPDVLQTRWLTPHAAGLLFRGAPVALGLCFAAFCVWFASGNHRSDRPAARVWTQAAALVTVATVGVAMVAWLEYLWRLR